MDGMTCPEVQDQMWRYVDRELPASDRASISAHLGTCAECRALFHESVRELRLCREALDRGQFGEKFVRSCMGRLRDEGLVRAAEDDRRVRGFLPSRRTLLGGVRAVAAVAVLIPAVAILIVLLVRSRPLGSFEARGLPVVTGWCGEKGTVRFRDLSAHQGRYYARSAFQIPDLSTLIIKPEGEVAPGGSECRVVGPAIFCIDEESGSDAFVASLRGGSGSVHAKVVPLTRDQKFVLTTPHARIRVVGTEFKVIVGPEETRVEVIRGVVKIESANLSDAEAPWSEAVPARGGSWVARKGQLPQRVEDATPEAIAPEAIAPEAIAPAAVGPADPVVSSVPEPATSGEDAGTADVEPPTGAAPRTEPPELDAAQRAKVDPQNLDQPVDVPK